MRGLLLSINFFCLFYHRRFRIHKSSLKCYQIYADAFLSSYIALLVCSYCRCYPFLRFAYGLSHLRCLYHSQLMRTRCQHQLNTKFLPLSAAVIRFHIIERTLTCSCFHVSCWIMLDGLNSLCISKIANLSMVDAVFL